MNLTPKASVLTKSLRRASRAIDQADGVLITAGAGMGVDSGMPDFRGKSGFWKAYPKLKQLGIHFEQMANPDWFDSDPEMAWAFYGHRYKLYRDTVPHEGFEILHRWASEMKHGAFVFTSNVDGHFQKSGFSPDKVCECHGSINQLQCTAPCDEIWPCDQIDFEVCLETLSVSGDVPKCPTCSAVARPNIKMFNDWSFLPFKAKEQKARLRSWIDNFTNDKLVIIEVGAGCAVPTVRWHSHIYSEAHKATLIRINPRENHAPRGAISLSLGGLEALRRIDETRV